MIRLIYLYFFTYQFLFPFEFQLVICLKSALETAQDKAQVHDNEEFVSIESDILKNDENSECSTTKIVAKIFLNEYSDTCIDEAFEKIAETFNNRVINTLILAYHPLKTIEQSSPSSNKDNKFVWADNDPQSKENFKKLWKKLQKYLSDGKVRFKTIQLNKKNTKKIITFVTIFSHTLLFLDSAVGRF